MGVAGEKSRPLLSKSNVTGFLLWPTERQENRTDPAAGGSTTVRMTTDSFVKHKDAQTKKMTPSEGQPVTDNTHLSTPKPRHPTFHCSASFLPPPPRPPPSLSEGSRCAWNVRHTSLSRILSPSRHRVCMKCPPTWEVGHWALGGGKFKPIIHPPIHPSTQQTIRFETQPSNPSTLQTNHMNEVTLPS